MRTCIGAIALFLLVVGIKGQVDRDFRVNRRQDTNDPETLLIRCYGRWGCLSIGGPFFASSRPVSVFPLHPEVLHIKFLLWTRRNPDTFHVLKSRDNGTFALSSFDATRPIKFIVHDYKGSGTMYWVEEMARELLTADNFNVIAVDWQVGAGPPYSQAVANARMVGVVIADLIKFVEDRYRMSASDMHIIGHGLGAHAAGYAGENARGLGRITGLDPSAAYFEGTSSEVRLDPTDAQFVDVIHTDIGTTRSPGEGIFQESGHLDFYPNGGRIQPGCYEGIMATQPIHNPLHNYAAPVDFDYYNYDGDSSYGKRRRRREAIGNEGRTYINCNHVRAYEIFLESINSDCSFYGYQCDSFRNFTSGFCKDGCGNNQASCAPIGMHSDEWRVNAIGTVSTRMYLETDFEEPLCRHHFHVEIFMSDSVEAIRHGNESGNVVMRLTGSKGKTGYLETTTYGPALFSPGQSYQSLISGPNLGRLLRLDMQWLAVARTSHHLQNNGAPLATGPSNSFRFPELYLERIIITNLETGIRSTFCGDSEPVKPATTKSVFVGGTCDGRIFN